MGDAERIERLTAALTLTLCELESIEATACAIMPGYKETAEAVLEEERRARIMGGEPLPPDFDGAQRILGVSL